uniref:Uncharacterized protein n=1 Tax=Triticum urartu TaxID=4572 RepID=A0A8R7QHY9_TRIUA
MLLPETWHRAQENRKKRKVAREQTSLLSPSETRFKSHTQLNQAGANGIPSQSKPQRL